MKDDLSIACAARSRLAYDELLASQLVLALRRQQARRSRWGPASASTTSVRADGVSIPLSEEAVAAVGDGGSSSPGLGSGEVGLVGDGLRRLPFELTGNQRQGE